MTLLLTLAATLLAAAGSGAPARANVCDEQLRPPQTTSQLSHWMSSLPKGAVGCLHAGTYGDGRQVYVDPSSAGSGEDDRRAVRNYPGEPLGDVTVNAGIYFSASADYYTMRLFNVNGASLGDDTIGLPRGADHIYLADLDVTNENRSGVHGCITSGGSYLIINRDRIHDCGGDNHFDHCVYLGRGILAQVANSVIYNCAAWAIHLYTNPDGAYIHNNVLDSSGGGVTFAGGTYNGECQAVDGARVEDNAITNMNGGRDDDAAVTTSWGCSVKGLGNMLADNCFHDNASGNASLDSTVITSGNIVADPLYGTALTISPFSGCYWRVGDPASVDHILAEP